MTAARVVPRAMARAVLVLWSARVLGGLLIGYPVARTLGAFVPAGAALGDGVLFAPGGLYLLEALRLGNRALGASSEGALVALVIVSVATLFPLGAALASLLYPRETAPALARRAAAAVPALFALAGATAFVQAVGVVVITAGAGQLSPTALAGMNERTADLVVAALILAACVPLSVIGLLHDLARAAVVRTDAGSRAAALRALEVLRRAPGAVARAWAGPTALGGVLVATAAWATAALDVSRPGSGRVAGVALVHQLAVLGLVALRLAWFARALELVGRTGTLTDEAERPSPGDRAAHSDAPNDPTPDRGA